ncbi:MAG: glycosyltransferase family 2 protein [Rhodothermus sp.]|nr:glycosyltransferase family 2 protein [Rhodothermus sp.]
MASPQVSVYMTVRNGAPWVSSAIQSILQQTLSDWELIIVDDGSTDDTPRILRSFARQDARIQVIATEGIGRGPALNLALQHTHAPYVANLDADDLAHPQRLELELHAIRTHPAFSLVASASIVFAERPPREWPVYAKERIPLVDITQGLLLFNPVIHSSVLMSRAAVAAVGGYCETLQDNLDYDLWVRLATSGYRLGLLNLPLVGKRIHPAQSFETRRHMRYVLSGARIQHQAIRHCKASTRYKLKAWLFLCLRIAWGFLPQRIRFWFRARRQQLAITSGKAGHSCP